MNILPYSTVQYSASQGKASQGRPWAGQGLPDLKGCADARTDETCDKGCGEGRTCEVQATLRTVL